MKVRTIEVWTAICRIARLPTPDDCGPAMYKSAVVLEAVFSIASELGKREASKPARLDDISEAVVVAAAGSMCEHEATGLLKVLKVSTRDTLRDMIAMIIVSLQLMDQEQLEYGPLPAGLTGRHLGFAAIALEILETRSPQRLLARQAQSRH